jgi:2-oxoglutarate ferredoxin oxidoreductase subunit beta
MIPEILEYTRNCRFPTIWCSGCGNGIVMQAMVRAIHRLKIPQNDVVAVSGIGCSSRVTAYVDFNTVHTAHGRPIAFATGIKMANPKLTVIVVTGDGDAVAIGGNHFIHAARRNIDITVILINNFIYGMTGGQASPTTPYGARATTAPYGQTEHGFDIAELAKAAGATFVSRTTTYHARQCETQIEQALENPGFSLVEAIAACPTAYGRYNNVPDGAAMLLQQRDQAVSVAKARKMTPEELEGKIVTGVFVNQKRPECRAEYQRLIDRLSEVA